MASVEVAGQKLDIFHRISLNHGYARQVRHLSATEPEPETPAATRLHTHGRRRRVWTQRAFRTRQ